MRDKFDARTWLLGTLLTLTILFGGFAFNSQAAALQSTTKTVNEHAERIAKLEAIQDTLKEILNELKAQK